MSVLLLLLLLQLLTAARRRRVTFCDDATRLIQSYFVASRQLRSTNDAPSPSMPINAVDTLYVQPRQQAAQRIYCMTLSIKISKYLLVVQKSVLFYLSSLSTIGGVPSCFFMAQFKGFNVKTTNPYYYAILDYNKKAQLSLTNPRDAKVCQKMLQFDVLTTLSLTILAYLHSFSCCCDRNLRNPAKFTKNSNLWSSRSSKVIDIGVNGKPICDFILVINSNFSRICYRFRDIHG